MVDALVEVHRVLAPGGILVDARPDSRVPAYAERRKPRGFQRYGVVNTSRLELANDRASDRAISLVVREGLFKRTRGGRFWHRVPFSDLAELRKYLWEHLRFVHRAEWVVGVATRKHHANDQFVIRRAVRYELLEAGTAVSNLARPTMTEEIAGLPTSLLRSRASQPPIRARPRPGTRIQPEVTHPVSL